MLHHQCQIDTFQTASESIVCRGSYWHNTTIAGLCRIIIQAIPAVPCIQLQSGWQTNKIPFVWHTGQLALTDAAHHHRAHPALAIAIWQLHYACWTHMAAMPGTIHAYCHNPGAEERRCPAQWDRCNVPVPATLGPRAESGRLPTSAIPRASVSDLRADARQPRCCRDKPAI